jgi:hypothetical protein
MSSHQGAEQDHTVRQMSSNVDSPLVAPSVVVHLPTSSLIVEELVRLPKGAGLLTAPDQSQVPLRTIQILHLNVCTISQLFPASGLSAKAALLARLLLTRLTYNLRIVH